MVDTRIIMVLIVSALWWRYYYTVYTTKDSSSSEETSTPAQANQAKANDANIIRTTQDTINPHSVYLGE